MSPAKNRHPHTGLFITFEGGEGAGKSTLIQELSSQFLSQGKTVLITREPGGCALGNQIRKMLLESEVLAPKAELLLFLANRAQHIEEIILPALHMGKIVLCDRFSDSTLAYQATARAIEYDTVETLCNFATSGLKPDVTLLLDLPPEIGLRRVKATRNATDRIEKETIEFHESVRQGFLKIAEKEPERVHVIDAAKGKEAVFEKALFLLSPYAEKV